MLPKQFIRRREMFSSKLSFLIHIPLLFLMSPIFRYDILVLATGSGAGLPPYVSMARAEKTKGVFVYRNIADLEKIMEYAEHDGVTRASVVGGGVSIHRR